MMAPSLEDMNLMDFQQMMRASLSESLHPQTNSSTFTNTGSSCGSGTNDHILSMFSVFAQTNEQAISLSILRHPRRFHGVSCAMTISSTAETKTLRANCAGTVAETAKLFDQVWMSKRIGAAVFAVRRS